MLWYVYYITGSCATIKTWQQLPGHSKLWLRHLGNLDKPHLVYLVWGLLLESFCLP